MNETKKLIKQRLFRRIYEMRSSGKTFRDINKDEFVKQSLSALGHKLKTVQQLKRYYTPHEKMAFSITNRETVFEPSVVHSEHKKSSIVRLTGDEEEQLQRILQSALKGAMMQPLLHTSIIIWTELVITDRINRKSGENHEQTTK